MRYGVRLHARRTAMSEEPTPLDEWSTLQRPRALIAIDLAIEFLEEGKVDAALAILQVLSTRFAVDQSVEEFFHLHGQFEGGECHVLHQ